MKKILGLIVIAAALAVSCEQQDIQLPSSRKAVQFTTSGVGTKTSYQGTVTDGKEAILWTDGDVFSVTCEQATISGDSKTAADYKVTAPSGGATAVNPNTPNDVIYWGEGSHTFFAAYPAGKLEGNVLNASIATTQRLTETSEGVFAPALSANGYLVAAATATPDDGNVNLVFNPLFSTLQFEVSAGNSSVQVGDISLVSGSAIAGDFKVTLGVGANPQLDFAPATATAISVKLGSSGAVSLASGQTLTFSVVVLPRDLTGLRVRIAVNGQTVEFPLKDNDGNITFAAGKKSIIRALGILGPEAEAAGITTVITDQGVDIYDLSVNP